MVAYFIGGPLDLCLVAFALVVVAGIVAAIVIVAKAPASKPPPLSGPSAGTTDNLVPCPDCGKPLSRLAVTCPHCGRPLSAAQSGEEAGAIMLARLKDLGAQCRSFAFETTLASRSFAPWLAELMQAGYEFHLVFLWLPSEDFAVQRVSDRVRMGGHDVPEQTVRRRCRAGLRNLFRLYRPLAATWRMYDNSDMAVMRLIASGEGATVTHVRDAALWQQIQHGYSHGE